MASGMPSSRGADLGHRGQFGQFGGAGHEAGQLDWQVVPVRAQRAQRREGNAQVRMAQLPHVFGGSQVRQPVPAEVGQDRARGQAIGHQPGRRLRQQDLTGPGNSGERDAPVDPVPGIAGLAGQASLAGVHGNPGRYRLPRQRALDGQGAGGGVRGAGEHGDGAAITVAAASQPGTGIRACRRRDRLAERAAGSRGRAASRLTVPAGRVNPPSDVSGDRPARCAGPRPGSWRTA
jgi:hypothetical protein